MTHIVREQLGITAGELVAQIRSAKSMLGRQEALDPGDVAKLKTRAKQLQAAAREVQGRIDRWDEHIQKMDPELRDAETEILQNHPIPAGSEDILGEGEEGMNMLQLVAKAGRVHNLLLAAIEEAKMESESNSSRRSRRSRRSNSGNSGDMNPLLLDAALPEAPIPEMSIVLTTARTMSQTARSPDPDDSFFNPLASSTPRTPTSVLPISQTIVPVTTTTTTVTTVTSQTGGMVGGANQMPIQTSWSTRVPRQITQGTKPMPTVNFQTPPRFRAIEEQRPRTFPDPSAPAFQPMFNPLSQQREHHQTYANVGRAETPPNHTSIFRHSRIEPPKFKGDAKEWPTFWMAFEESVDFMEIPNYQKHILLLQYLERDSTARKAIEAYQPSNENYPVVVQILKNKFGNVSVLREQLRAELYHRPMANNSTHSLRSLSEDIERICLQLNQLSTTGEGDFVRTIIRSKLPQPILLDLIQREWDSGHEWSECELRQGLARIVAMREAAETAVKTLRPEEEKKHQDSRNHERHGRGGTQNVRSFAGVDTNSNGTPTASQPPSKSNGNPSRRNWKDKICSLCDEKGHTPSHCPKFPTPQKRREQLARQNRCFKCLSSGHMSPDCKASKECRFCKATNHHSLICNEASRGDSTKTSNSSGQGKPVTEAKTQTGAPVTRTAVSINKTMEPEIEPIKTEEDSRVEPEDELSHAFAGTTQAKRPQAHLMTRLVTVAPGNDPQNQVQALLFFDPGSQTSYIASSLVEKFSPKKVGEDRLNVEVFGGTRRGFKSPRFEVQIQCTNKGWESVELSEVDKIGSVMITNQWEGPDLLPDQEVPEDALQTIQGVPEILIGTRQFWNHFISRTPVESGYYVIQTIFGAVVGGESSLPEPEEPLFHSYSMMAVHPSNQDQMPTANQIEEFWSLETIGIKEDPSRDDDQVAERMFESSNRQLDDGRYCVRWPWKEAHPELPSNFRTAYSRLNGTLNKFRHNPELLSRYQKVLDDQISRGIIEEAEIRPGTKEHYLPHHAVITPEKIRIVHEANSHVKGSPCLNDCLYKGPTLLPALDGMLLRFRCCKCPVCADVEKAFLMIEIEPEDREVCKFLWIRDPTKPLTAANLVVYRFKRVAFGVVSSPFMLQGTLRTHYRKYESPLARQLEGNTFVDNALMENEETKLAIQNAKEAKQIFADAKMNLREYVSCSAEVMEAIPEEDRLNKPIVKVLGIKWDTQTDELLFFFPNFPIDGMVSRRTVLSTYSSFFDPQGLFGPCLLASKLFFQELWELSHGWDDPLEQDRVQEWLRLMEPWRGKSTRIPRYVLIGGWQQLEVHVFTDASEHAFAAAVYVRSQHETGIDAQVIFSKCHLKPRKHAKTLTIPRMELLGIRSGAYAQAFVAKQLHRPVDSIHLWSDSMIALGWVQSGKPVAQFIDRRVQEIRSHPEIHFHFVRTDQNPADIATRGSNPEGLEHNLLWWKGPDWLRQSPEGWPRELQFRIDKDPDPVDVPPETDELELAMATRTMPHSPPERSIDPAKYGSLFKLLRITCWVLKFIHRSRGLGPRIKICPSPFKAEDLEKAKRALIWQEQMHIRVPMPGLVMDDAGIYRVHARLDYSIEPHSFKRPIELPKQSPLAEHFIRQAHLRLKHGGVDWTRAEFLAEYSMEGSRRMVTRHISRCPRCVRMNSPKYALPRMPPLPEDRVQKRRPFESIGIDYLGPTMAKVAGKSTKVWVVIITCLTVRAVYLEPTADLSARSFIQVLRRFIARRGCPKRCLSDNAKTFVSTEKVLTKLAEPDVSSDPAEFAAFHGIDWHFIPQHSPWSGGIYERLVALVKKCVQRTLGRWILPYDDFSAFLAEVEASINMRPLTYISSDPNSFLPLRPVDFIQPEANLFLPIHGQTFDPDDPNLTAHEKLAAFWLGTQDAVAHFWHRWRKEYLLMLREKSGWVHKHPRLQTMMVPKVGDVVLVEEALQPRNVWPMGRIEAVNGNPPIIRSVQIRMANGRIWVRPVNKIYPLEASPEMDKANPDANQQGDPQVLAIETNPENNTEPDPETPPESHSDSEEELVEKPSKDMEYVPTAHHRKKAESKGSPMLLRKKVRLGAATILPILLCFFNCIPGTLACSPHTRMCDQPSPLPPCQDCAIQCTDKGVVAIIPPKVNKLDLCCMNTCWTTVTDHHNQSFELPKEFLLNDYRCTGTFWENSQTAFWAEANCPAKNECALLDCWICVEQIANPTCNPQLVVTLLAGAVLLFLSALGFLWNTLMRIKTGAWVFYQAVALLIRLPLMAYRRITGRNVPLPTAAAVKHGIQSGTRKIQQRFRRTRHEFRGGRMVDFRREFLRQWQIPLLGFIFALLPFIQCGSETIAVVTQSESCRRGQTGIHCTINSATTLTLLPVGQSNTLLMRDEHGIVLGVLTLQLQSLAMNCMSKSEAWLRAYRIETLAVKRCPRAGSCRGNHCGEVRMDSKVPELDQANPFPGNTFCADSTSFWHNKCGLPASACLYYRWHAKPLSKIPFELVSCPSWDLTIQADLSLETNGGKRFHKQLTLHPGITENWGNISLAPLAYSLPPSPVLSSKFITDGQRVAMVNQMPEDLHCTDEEHAREFNCSLSVQACQPCSLAHDSGSATCHCRDLDIEGIMENPAARLPLNIARIHLKNDGPAIIAETGYSPIQVHVQMKELQLIMEFQDSKCWIENAKLAGCYKCAAGAQLSFGCKTDWGSALAGITCEDGTTLAAHCSSNTTEQTVVLPFTQSHVSTQCRVDCPAGETSFHLTAQLFYVPLKRQFGYQSRTSPRLDDEPVDSRPWFDFGFDPWALFGLLANYLPLFLMALIFGAVVLFIVIKLSPIYHFYRLMHKMMIGPFAPALALCIIPGIQAVSPSNASIGLMELENWPFHSVPDYALYMGAMALLGFGIFIALIICHLCCLCCLFGAQEQSMAPIPAERRTKVPPTMAKREGASLAIRLEIEPDEGAVNPSIRRPYRQATLCDSQMAIPYLRIPQRHNRIFHIQIGCICWMATTLICFQIPGSLAAPNFPPGIPDQPQIPWHHWFLAFILIPLLIMAILLTTDHWPPWPPRGTREWPPRGTRENEEGNTGWPYLPAHINILGQPVDQSLPAPHSSDDHFIHRTLGFTFAESPLDPDILFPQINMPRSNASFGNGGFGSQNARNVRHRSTPPPSRQNPPANAQGQNPSNPRAQLVQFGQFQVPIYHQPPRTRSQSSQPPTRARSQPSQPSSQIGHHGQRLDQWIMANFCPEWHRTNAGRQQVLDDLNRLLGEGWTLARIRTGGTMNPTNWTRESAAEALVDPVKTVEQFWKDDGRPLFFPDWPCLTIGGGVRGTSRESRRRQEETGRPPWRAGQRHEDLIPAEGLILRNAGIQPLNAIQSADRPGANSEGQGNNGGRRRRHSAMDSANFEPLGSRRNSGRLSPFVSNSPAPLAPSPLPFIDPEPGPNPNPNPPPIVVRSSREWRMMGEIPDSEMPSPPASPIIVPEMESIPEEKEEESEQNVHPAEGKKENEQNVPSVPIVPPNANEGEGTPASNEGTSENRRQPSVANSIRATPPEIESLLLLIILLLLTSRANSIDSDSNFIPANYSPIPFVPNWFNSSVPWTVPTILDNPVVQPIWDNSSWPTKMPSKSTKGYVCSKCGLQGHRSTSSKCALFVSQAKHRVRLIVPRPNAFGLAPTPRTGHHWTAPPALLEQSNSPKAPPVFPRSPEENPPSSPVMDIIQEIGAGPFVEISPSEVEKELNELGPPNPENPLGEGPDASQCEGNQGGCDKQNPNDSGPSQSEGIPGENLDKQTTPHLGQIDQQNPGEKQMAKNPPGPRAKSVDMDKRRVESFESRLRAFKAAKFPEHPVVLHMRETKRKENEEMEAKRKKRRENPNAFFVEEAEGKVIIARAQLKAMEKAARKDPKINVEKAKREEKIAIGALIAAEIRLNRQTPTIRTHFLRNHAKAHAKEFDGQNPLNSSHSDGHSSGRHNSNDSHSKGHSSGRHHPRDSHSHGHSSRNNDSRENRRNDGQNARDPSPRRSRSRHDQSANRDKSPEFRKRYAFGHYSPNRKQSVSPAIGTLKRVEFVAASDPSPQPADAAKLAETLEEKMPPDAHAMQKANASNSIISADSSSSIPSPNPIGPSPSIVPKTGTGPAIQGMPIAQSLASAVGLTQQACHILLGQLRMVGPFSAPGQLVQQAQWILSMAQLVEHHLGPPPPPPLSPKRRE